MSLFSHHERLPAAIAGSLGILLWITKEVHTSWLTYLSARLAGFYVGVSPILTDRGWRLPLGDIDVFVNASCSGFVFFSTLSCLLAWLIARESPPGKRLSRLCLGLAVCIVTAPMVNGARVLVAYTLHKSIALDFFVHWQSQIHLFGGILTFLPALTLIFAITQRGLQHEKHS